MLLVIINATLYILLYSFAGKGGTRNAIYLDSSRFAGFHAIPFVEQTLFYFIEVVGSLLVGKRLNLYYLSFLDIDRKGRIANDKVFRTADLYFAGDIPKEECLCRLIFEEPNNQICIRTQRVLDECLTFKSSQKL